MTFYYFYVGGYSKTALAAAVKSSERISKGLNHILRLVTMYCHAFYISKGFYQRPLAGIEVLDL